MGLYEGVRAKLDIKEVIAELRNETVRLDQAIAALERLDSYPELSKSPTVRKLLAPAGKQTGRRLTAEGRKRLSESMKKRWAERRKKG
jgi:hypothetical protein